MQIEDMPPPIGLNNILLTIVLYKRKLVEADTYQCLLKAVATNAQLAVLVYDNSPLGFASSSDNSPMATNTLTIIYHHNPTNAGVAGAYMYAANKAKELGKSWLVFFDQDSKLPKGYFNTLLEAINKPVIDNGLYCPLVISNRVVISPSYFRFGRAWVKPEKAIGTLPAKGHTIINSGIALSLTTFETVNGYCNKLPLDFSDHYFFFKYKQTFTTFQVLNVTVAHSLSSLNEHDYWATLQRFKLYYAAAKQFSAYTRQGLVMFWAFLRAVKLSIKFFKPSFIIYATALFRK